MAKKRQIYCKCGSPADWYKKGHKHRVLICNSCGLIANNPIPFLAIAGSMAVKKGIEMISPDHTNKPPLQKDKSQLIFTDSKDKPNYSERVINEVMKTERLY